MHETLDNDTNIRKYLGYIYGQGYDRYRQT